MSVAGDVYPLLVRAQREALLVLCEAGQTPFSGLQAGARFLRKGHRLQQKTIKRLNNLDTAFAMARHITEQHVDLFLSDLRAELRVHSSPPPPRAKPSTTPPSAPPPSADVPSRPPPNPKDGTATGTSPASTSAQPRGDRELRRPNKPPSAEETLERQGQWAEKPRRQEQKPGRQEQCADDMAASTSRPPFAQEPLRTRVNEEPASTSSPPKDITGDQGVEAYTSFEDYLDNLQLYGVQWPASGHPIRNRLEQYHLCCVRQAFIQGRRDNDHYFAVIVGLKQRADLNGHLAWVAARDLVDHGAAIFGSDRVGAVPIPLEEFGIMVYRKSSGGSRRHLLGSAGIRVKLANLRFVNDVECLLYHVFTHDPF